MIILAIETSCDETAISIIEVSGGFRAPYFKILSNIVSSQIKIHAPFGGVVPNLAKREHQRNLAIILKTALRKAGLLNSKISVFSGKNSKSKIQMLNSILEREPELLKQFIKKVLPLKKPEINAIAVTIGPGLEPALWVGVNFSRALSYLWEKPLIPVNHMEGHLASVLLEQNRGIYKSKFQIPKVEFPAVALLVSGGHTQLVLIKNWLKYKVIGETLDDAAGEAFDKVARLLNLGYPGGPAIAAEAEKHRKISEKLRFRNARAGSGNNNVFLNRGGTSERSFSETIGDLKINLPKPMINSKDYNFSFSGLKTAVLYLIRDLEAQKANIKKLVPTIAYEFENAVVEVLVKKTLRAAKEYGAKSVILAGGVAANKKLRLELGEALKEKLPSTKYFLPDPEFTGDNAAMVVGAGYLRFLKKEIKGWSEIKAKSNLKLK